MNRHMGNYDVAVVGAGPAGSTLALRLVRQGLRVILLESSRFDRPRVGESLAPDIQPFLVELGLWPAFLALEPLPSYGTRSVWGGREPLTHAHLVSPYGTGWHVNRLALDAMLAREAAAAGVVLRLGARVTGCAPAGKGWELQWVGEQLVQKVVAAFVVDATGRTAQLARRLGGERATFDRLVGVAGQVHLTESPAQGYTLVETTPDGWWYSAPVAPDRLVAMWMTDGDLLKPAGALPGWQAALAEAVVTAGRLRPAGRQGHEPRLAWGPQPVSAVSQRLWRRECDRPWLAVGDAALAVDPITGSGVVRALKTAQAGTVAVLSFLAGERLALEQYEQARNTECLAYLHERLAYYGLEQRWPQAPFWQRRLRAAALSRQIHSRPA